jgi:hypothetical protein
VPGQGRRLFELVAENDLAGIVAKRLGDPCAPGRTVWWKMPSGAYSQKDGRSERFERVQEVRFERGRDAHCRSDRLTMFWRRPESQELAALWAQMRDVPLALVDLAARLEGHRSQRPRVALPVESVGARCNCFV